MKHPGKVIIFLVVGVIAVSYLLSFLIGIFTAPGIAVLK
jgi:hypothetical protein